MKISVLVASVLVIAGSLSGVAIAQDNAELIDANRALQEARENLERAAREVARLSAQANSPGLAINLHDFERSGRRAMLGINISDDESGVLVAGVSPGGPADESGIETGDIIIAIEDADLTGNDASAPTELLVGYMAGVQPGESVELTLLRDGDEQEVTVEARALDAQSIAGRLYASPAVPYMRGDMPGGLPQSITLRDMSGLLGRWADMELVELTPTLGAYFGTEEGILVVRAPSDDELQLMDGDVILEIGGRTPMNRGHAMRILGSFEAGETLELTIMRDQRRQTLELEITASGRRG